LEKLGVTHLFHSPLSRAAETASIVSRGRTYELVAEAGFLEADLGIMQGRSESDPRTDFISAWLNGERLPGAEPYVMFRARVASGLLRSLNSCVEGRALILAHWGVFAALSDLLKQPREELDHCKPYEFVRREGQWLVRRCGGAFLPRTQA
jgi:probable phosphoglycerate mutase